MTGGPLMSQLPLYFLMMDNENWAHLRFYFALLIFHHRYTASECHEGLMTQEISKRQVNTLQLC